MGNNKYVKFCKCGCGNGVVLKFDREDGELSLQLVSDNFYAYQGNVLSIKEKLKRVWRIIVNKEHCYFDILMGKEDMRDFKEFVAKL